jgi:hypothetical protein
MTSVGIWGAASATPSALIMLRSVSLVLSLARYIQPASRRVALRIGVGQLMLYAQRPTTLIAVSGVPTYVQTYDVFILILIAYEGTKFVGNNTSASVGMIWLFPFVTRVS